MATASSPLTARDLLRPLGEVARALAPWRRGDVVEAVAFTLAHCARDLHRREYTLWAWAGRTAADEEAWVLPVPSATAETYSPKGPAHVLARSLDAAVYLDVAPGALRLEDWAGWTCLVAPGVDPELAAMALDDAHPAAVRVELERLPRGTLAGGAALDLAARRSGRGDGVGALASQLGVHPVRVVLALAEAGQPVDLASYDPHLVTSLVRDWRRDAAEPEVEPAIDDAAGLDIADDPCPRRRHARTVLQRMLRMGKVGPGYHTDITHFYRGAPAHERQQALEVAEALLRAGLLGEKPSVGQRHIFLARDALREIHALIERGETRSPVLAATWTAPAPTGSRAPSR